MKIPELISSLIAKELQGKITLEERKILDDWYNQPDLRVLATIKTNRAANLKKLHKKIPLYPTPTLPFKWLGWAAAVLIFCFGLTQVFFPDHSENLETVAMDETFEMVDNPRGVRRKLLMPDSSVIHLNGGSRLQIQKSFLTKRKVILEGEAFFEVAKDPGNPFVVITEGLVTKVLGTSFLVSAYKGKPQMVAVKEGKVNVKEAMGNSYQNQELLVNEQLTYRKEEGLGSIQIINPQLDRKFE
ncbi:MAG: FecR domain-containing protein [Cyclobacteriaceae bacterium]